MLRAIRTSILRNEANWFGGTTVGEASARVATLQVQVAQAEGGATPAVDPIESPTNEIVTTAESAVPPAASLDGPA